MNSNLNRIVIASLFGLSLLLVAGCGQSAPQEVAQTTPAVEQAAPAQALERLPVSLNTVMVAMVNQAADPLWVAAWRNPESDKDWRELERRAIQLELGGTLLSVPGTGPLDDAWTGDENWQKWSAQLREVGGRAVAAVKARDIERISAAGDDIVEVCEGCHIDFKLAMPTGGEFGELSPTADDFKE